MIDTIPFAGLLLIDDWVSMLREIDWFHITVVNVDTCRVHTAAENIQPWVSMNSMSFGWGRQVRDPTIDGEGQADDETDLAMKFEDDENDKAGVKSEQDAVIKSEPSSDNDEKAEVKSKEVSSA